MLSCSFFLFIRCQRRDYPFHQIQNKESKWQRESTEYGTKLPHWKKQKDDDDEDEWRRRREKTMSENERQRKQTQQQQQNHQDRKKEKMNEKNNNNKIQHQPNYPRPSDQRAKHISRSVFSRYRLLGAHTMRQCLVLVLSSVCWVSILFSFAAVLLLLS